MELSDYQKEFTKSVCLFLEMVIQQGYSITLGEAYRPPEMAAIYAKEGSGIVHSLHTQRLAIDLNIFDKSGKFLTELADLEPVGRLWEAGSYDVFKHTWGGRFAKPDADHFSIEYQGVR